LKVLTGKILEQSVFELEQEEEIKNIRKSKQLFLARLMKEKDEIKQLEEKENDKKNNFENFKKIKRLDKYSKISTQQKLMSRVFSISYLQKLKNCTIDLVKNTYKDYKTITLKDIYNKSIYEEIDKNLKMNEAVLNSIIDITNNIHENNKHSHLEVVINRKQSIIRQKQEAEKKRIADEEQRKIEKEQQIERRKKRAILRLERNVQQSIINQPLLKGPYYSEDISEINNMNGDGPFGIFY
jgi:hypothetical protein